MPKTRRVHFAFDERSLVTAEQLAQQGRNRIAPGMSCECCGAREITTGCVRGMLPCDCNSVTSPPEERFRQLIPGWSGYRCRRCRRCPGHCVCEAQEGEQRHAPEAR
jgi:hypothetical protein